MTASTGFERFCRTALVGLDDDLERLHAAVVGLLRHVLQRDPAQAAPMRCFPLEPLPLHELLQRLPEQGLEDAVEVEGGKAGHRGHLF